MILVTQMTYKTQALNLSLSDIIYSVEVNKYKPKPFSTLIVNANLASLTFVMTGTQILMHNL